MQELTGVYLINFPTGRDIVIMLASGRKIHAFCNGKEVALTDEETKFFWGQLKEVQTA